MSKTGEDGLIVAQQVLGVFILHLVSGEDIIGKVALEKDEETGMSFYVVINPLRPNISQARGPDGRPTLQFNLMPLFLYFEDANEITIPVSYVMFPVQVKETDKLYKAYISQTSGIELADASQLPDGKSLVIP